MAAAIFSSGRFRMVALTSCSLGYGYRHFCKIGADKVQIANCLVDLDVEWHSMCCKFPNTVLIIEHVAYTSQQPFLTSLGFGGASTALVWGISPICGTFVQPWFGAVSDKHQWQERGQKTCLLAGSVFTSISLVGFSLSREQTLWLISSVGLSPSEETRKILARTCSVIWFALLNITIQPLQMASRAIIVENNDSSDQVAASAWASRMQGIGSILGFLLGSLPLSAILPGNITPDFALLCVLGSLILCSTAMLSASFITLDTNPKEARHILSEIAVGKGKSDSFCNLRTVPSRVWQIFIVQFFSWLGWFPFRTYYTRCVASRE
jgi:solute carrier family 45, member 1/2/4